MQTFPRLRQLLYSGALSIKDLATGIVPYVGFPNNGNLGDEFLYRLAIQYLSPTNFEYNLASRGRFLKASLLKTKGHYLVGGGSLIFGWDFLAKFQKLDDFGLAPVFWGTGSRDLSSDKDEQKVWANVLRRARGCVRGELTAKSFRQLGLDVDVIGDMGFLVNLSFSNVCPPEKYILIIPRLVPERAPELHLLDLRRLDYLSDLIKKLCSQGLKIIVYLPDINDRVSLAAWLAKLPASVLIQEYGGIDTGVSFLKLARSAKAVVSMRLHPGLFAYSLGVPTLFFESRAKYHDTFSVLPTKPTIIDADAISKFDFHKDVENLIVEPLDARAQRFGDVKNIALRQEKYSRDVLSILN